MHVGVKSIRTGSARLLVMLVGAVLIAFLATFSALAWRTGLHSNGLMSKPMRSVSASPLQGTANGRDRLLGRLALQPEADKFRRRLGQRFLAAGREVAVWPGTVTQGTERYNVQVTRTQEESGEQVTVALNGGAAVLTWNGNEGVKTGNQPAAGNLRALVERLALDSPDQFVMAQLRGASYFVAARMARPASAGGADNYTGPVWDLVRVAEPANTNSNKPQSLWRLYHLNSATGLIDKVVSQEQGNLITAAFSTWTNQNGELVPTRITWTSNGQTVMELTLTNVGYTAKQ